MSSSPHFQGWNIGSKVYLTDDETSRIHATHCVTPMSPRLSELSHTCTFAPFPTPVHLSQAASQLCNAFIKTRNISFSRIGFHHIPIPWGDTLPHPTIMARVVLFKVIKEQQAIHPNPNQNYCPKEMWLQKGQWVAWAKEMASGGRNLPNSWPVKSKLATRSSPHFKGEIKTRLSGRAGPNQKGDDTCNQGNMQTPTFPFSSSPTQWPNSKASYTHISQGEVSREDEDILSFPEKIQKV